MSYVVISKWEFLPSQLDAVRQGSMDMMNLIRSWDGVEDAFDVQTGETALVAVITYRDQETYKRLVSDPNGPFERAAKESNLEGMASWLWSERGEKFA